jgi:hypothetical protein
MPCTICNHPQRQTIDQALIAGSVTLAALSQEYGLSTSALHRHKAHLQAKVNRAQDQLQDNLHQGCIFWLSQALEMAMQTAVAAQTEGNGKLVLQAIQQGTRLINIILKQDFHLDDRVVYGILTSPQWSTQTGLLPHDPKIMAMSRQSLAGALSSPCSETSDSAPIPSSLSPEDLDLLQAILPALTQKTGQPGNANRKQQTGNRMLKKWEKSGKLPGKTLSCEEIIEEIQRDSRCEKNAGKSSPLCPPAALSGQIPAAGSSDWLEEIDAGRLNIATLHAIGAGRQLPEPLTFPGL